MYRRNRHVRFLLPVLVLAALAGCGGREAATLPDPPGAALDEAGATEGQTGYIGSGNKESPTDTVINLPPVPLP